MAGTHAPSMRVSLAFVEHRVNVWLRFGQPVREIVLDRWRNVAVIAPRTVCCRVKWIGNYRRRSCSTCSNTMYNMFPV